MDLTPEEQCLISEFRKLSPSGRDELLTYATSLMRQAGPETRPGTENTPNQCRIKKPEQRPEADNNPIFTE